jgi:predicted ATPase
MDDLELLSGHVARAAAGTRQLVLLCGEPGIGKTRLAAECALRAAGDGAIVLYGRCDPEALLPQQPFVEALRHYICTCPVSELHDQPAGVSGELRRMVPELADRVPGLPQPLAGDPEGARSRRFEAACSLLCEAAQQAPLVLVLDDLHWADRATLLLLKCLARYPREARLMVLGTYRETELDPQHPLLAVIADLGAEHLLEQHQLARLDPPAVAELVALQTGGAAGHALQRDVFDATAGNPFFVVELLRDHLESATAEKRDDAVFGLSSALAVPQSVKDVVWQRLARLGGETHRVLAMAAVLGRVFELDVLDRLTGVGEDELVDLLETAVRARMIDDVAGVADRYTFTHALIRDTLYGGLSATRLARLHHRAGCALEQARAEDLDAHAAHLAHHFALSGSSGAVHKAIEYGSRAGVQAIAQLAYEQAATHFRQAVALIDATDPVQRAQQRCDLIIAEGEAERQAGDPAYRQTLLQAARLAQTLGDPERLARAALANNRGFSSSADGVDRDRVAVLHAALDAYDPADSATRAALLALLAVELVGDRDWQRRDELSDEALAMARRVADERALALVLTQHAVAQWRAQKLAEFQANLHEALELAERLDDPLLAGHSAYLGAHAAMEAGDLALADRLLERLGAVARELGQPVMRWFEVVALAKRRLIDGPPQEAERLAFAALQLGTSAGQADVTLWFLGQLFVARFLQGTLAAGDPHLPDVVDAPGSTLPTPAEITPSESLPLLFSAAMSIVHNAAGRVADARAHFALVVGSDLEHLPQDYTTLAIPAHATVACARLGDIATARRLRAILEPQSHLLVNTGASWFGATTHYLGLLAATIGDRDEAQAWFAAAEQTYTSLGAAPWLARLRSDRAAARTPR